MSVPHVLFIVTNAAKIGPHGRRTGFFFPEIAHPFEVFDAAGVAAEYASPLGGATPDDGYDEKDPAQRAFRESMAIRRLNRSRKLAEVDVLDYDAIFFPGGLGPMVDIARNPDVQRAVARAWNGGKLVTAVCHGPAAFLGVTSTTGLLSFEVAGSPPSRMRRRTGTPRPTFRSCSRPRSATRAPFTSRWIPGSRRSSSTDG